MRMNMFKRKSVDVIFLIEHKDRELETVKNVALCLKEDFNVQSCIMSAYFHIPRLLFMRAKVLVMPYITSQELELVKGTRALFGNQVSYVNMNWEQMLSEGMKESKAPRDVFVRKIVKHFAWDESFKGYLVSNGVIPDNVFVTGRPYYSLLRTMQEKRDALRSQFAARFGLDISKPWYFFPDNLGWKFQSDKAIRARIKGGWAEDKAYEYRSLSDRCLKEFAFLIKKMDERNYTPIIIRPHPSITVEEYSKAFANYGVFVSSNVRFSKNGTANDWVTASDVIGSSWSTVVLDAFQLGKKCFLFQPFDLPRWLSVPWHEKVRRIRTFEELEQFLQENGALGPPFLETRDEAVRQTAVVLKDICHHRETKSSRWSCERDVLFLTLKGLFFLLTPFRTKSKRYLLDYFRPLEYSTSDSRSAGL